MKANAPKRKAFQDAVDLISPPEEMINPVSSGQTMPSLQAGESDRLFGYEVMTSTYVPTIAAGKPFMQMQVFRTHRKNGWMGSTPFLFIRCFHSSLNSGG